MKTLIMLAAENDALRGGKVGGVGDVVRDLPAELARLGWKVTTIIPSYGFLHVRNSSRKIAAVEFPFEGKMTAGDLYETVPKTAQEGVTHCVFEHPALRGEPIYFNDPPDQAYAQDATKYALFCSAIGQYLKNHAPETVVHLHDWHTGFYVLLRELHPQFAHLKKLRTVFTIHNLAYQGNRPMKGPVASVERWFPELFTSTGWITTWKDPRFAAPNFTPIAAGIRFSDMVNTVSPTYAGEILRPSDHANGFYGGEGLEAYLRQATEENRLVGILNGAEYPDRPAATPPAAGELPGVIGEVVRGWNAVKADPLHADILSRLDWFAGRAPKILMCSVTRVTEQKVRLLFEKGSDGKTAIDRILPALDAAGGAYLFVGTGTADYEELLTKTCRTHRNLLYLKGYSDRLATALYRTGTLFMMPSSFEPCGIGQMIAMRDSQPCIVHATGGLKDTVSEGVNGFLFDGATIREQVDGLVAAAARAVTMILTDPARWAALRSEAGKARFTWEASARKYDELVYRS